MLPIDVKMCNDALKNEKEKQLHIDEHLKEMTKKEHVSAYSHGVFQRAAIEWLISTGQVSVWYLYGYLCLLGVL